MRLPPILSVAGVRHRWAPHGPDVVSIDQFAVQAGESVLLHGPSGCGKSTFLSAMAGVLSPQAGRIEVAGRAWQDMRGAQRDGTAKRRRTAQEAKKEGWRRAAVEDRR